MAGRLRCFSVALLLPLCACLIGCERSEPVVVYTVPTKVPDELRAGNDRMLAAMIPKQEKVWFVKVTGPETAVKTIAEDYRRFVEQLAFEDDGPVLDELPDGWRRGGKKAMRFASIDVDTPNKQLDISISFLSRQDDWDGFVAMNVNRWRGQLGLTPSQEEWAGGEAIDVPAGDGDAVWVDLVGEPGDSGSMMPPFAGMSANGGPPRGTAAPAGQGDRPASGSASGAGGSAASTSQKPIEFDRPEGWRDGRMTSMRWAAFSVGPEDAAGEITVIPAGGDLRGNVARWLGQIRAGTVPDDVVDQSLADGKKLQVDGRDSQRYLLTGDDPDSGDVIDVTVVPIDGTMSLFVKMQGPATTVRGQDEKITSFLDSIRLKL